MSRKNIATSTDTSTTTARGRSRATQSAMIAIRSVRPSTP
jgi:hypothetical protein